MIRLAEPALWGNETTYVDDALRRRQLSSGSYVARFEQAFTGISWTKHALATSSGTTALHLALLALDIGIGDEVIVPALTYVATANAVSYCGATPVLADIDPETWVIDPDRVADAITSRTRAIIPVHLYGHPADMDALRQLADGFELALIEDAAEAPGALYKGQPVGCLGNVAAFSFYGNKIITTGEGGMLTTDNTELAQRAARLRGQGQDPERRYWHPEVGYNYRMGELQAAVGLAQVEKFYRHLDARYQVAKWYRQHGTGPWVWQAEADWAQSAHWLNVALLHPDANRAIVEQQMARAGIETRPAFYPLHWLPPYVECGERADYLHAEHIAMRGLCLPSHALLTEDDVKHICATLRAACEAA